MNLTRWRGHALTRLGHPDATAVLTRLDTTFVRAGTALRVDLATAHTANGDQDEARTHAARLTAQLGSARQRRRIKILLATVRA